MSTYKINLKEQTATSINGIIFKLTQTRPGEYEGVCLNPKDIPHKQDDPDKTLIESVITKLQKVKQDKLVIEGWAVLGT